MPKNPTTTLPGFPTTVHLWFGDFKFYVEDVVVKITEKKIEAGATFDNSFFDNSFGFLRQFKNRSFLDPVFVHATGRRQN